MSSQSSKINWFTKNKRAFYIILMILCTITCIVSIYLAFTQTYTGTKKFLIFIMPLLFAYYIYFYIKKLKELKSND